MRRALLTLAAASSVGAAAFLFPPQDPGSLVMGDAERGRQLFRGAGRCVECHRFEEVGSPVRGPVFDAHWRSGPSLAERLADRPTPDGWVEEVPGDAYLAQSLLEPSVHVVEGFEDVMPAALEPLLGLGATDVGHLVAYLNPPASGPAKRLVALPPLADVAASDPWERLPQGDAGRGEARFFRPDDSSCSGCHLIRLPRLENKFYESFWEAGGLNGPELTRLALVQTPEQVLESILQPHARNTPGFDEILVVTPGSRLVPGILLARSEDGVLLQVANPAGPVFKWMGADEIDEIDPIVDSRMTPVFSELTTPQERLDLLAFLRVAALESDEFGADALPGGPWGSRAPSAPLFDGVWPEDLPLELLQRIPGIPVQNASPPENGN